MIAIVYSGSRYAIWKISDKGKIISDFKTAGINAYSSDEKSISQLLNKNDSLVTFAERIRRIYFFGNTAFFDDRRKMIESAFSKFFRFSKVSVEHDLKAAALATCGDHAGIVGILGSGSNAAYYTGKKIRENNFGLGFILADEGSANWFGRRLLKDFLNGTLPRQFEQKFVHKYKVDRKQILDKVYKQPQPVQYLSSYVDFLLENKQDDYVNKLVHSGFQQYFEKYIIPLGKKYPDVPVNFVGSVASEFESGLQEAAELNGITINQIVREPIYNVLNYYTSKNQSS